MRFAHAGVLGLALVALVDASAAGQPVVIGHVFVGGAGAIGEGSATPVIHLGGGGEFLVTEHLGVQGEIGYLADPSYFSDGVGAFSINGVWHVVGVGGRGRLSPFVTGGYSRLFREGLGPHMFNVGGGTDCWLSGRVGLRFEMRDYVLVEEGTYHLLGGFAGLVWR